jgi:hypothetical protein
MSTVTLEQAVQGMRGVEERLLALAAERKIHGFKIEWNEDLDFGHLMDPVPVALLTDGGRVQGRFSLGDLTEFPRNQPRAVTEEIDRLVRGLADTPHQGPPLHEPPGAP